MLNNYNRIARLYPAILCSIPIFAFNYFLLNVHTAEFFGSLEGVKWTGGITISIVLTFLLAQASRFIGKELFEKTHFNDELHMPTTELLLHSDSTYSIDHKGKLHAKILSDFGIRIFSPTQEVNDITGARKAIVESTGMIRGMVKDGRLILQHNREYGFVRNLIGGSVIAVFVSIVDLFIFGHFFPNMLAYYISLFLAIAYTLIMIIGKPLMSRYGRLYAKVLVQEYLGFQLPKA